MVQQLCRQRRRQQQQEQPARAGVAGRQNGPQPPQSHHPASALAAAGTDVGLAQVHPSTGAGSGGGTAAGNTPTNRRTSNESTRARTRARAARQPPGAEEGTPPALPAPSSTQRSIFARRQLGQQPPRGHALRGGGPVGGRRAMTDGMQAAAAAVATRCAVGVPSAAPLAAPPSPGPVPQKRPRQPPSRGELSASSVAATHRKGRPPAAHSPESPRRLRSKALDMYYEAV
jgi:hypothetical protein